MLIFPIYAIAYPSCPQEQKKVKQKAYLLWSKSRHLLGERLYLKATVYSDILLLDTQLKGESVSHEFYNICVQQFMQVTFFGLIFALLLSLSIYWNPRGRIGCQEIDGKRKAEKRRPKNKNYMNCRTQKW